MKLLLGASAPCNTFPNFLAVTVVSGTSELIFFNFILSLLESWQTN
jgi:hypothetical protein